VRDVTEAGGAPEVVAEATLALRVRAETDSRRVTFRSRIDDSVQYYAIRPATGEPVEPATGDAANHALVLSLHGASVEATSQADAYASKAWAHIVAPTNRRPFGFDWEDWGRLDALEVLEHAQRTLPHDPRRVVLTGHSMGGHGTWQLGAHFPGTFAAVAPSAGWISFWSYGGGVRLDETDAVQAMFTRAASPSDTLALKANLAHPGVYILHGDADDNVPVSEARRMREELAPLGGEVRWHEQPGAGHWWESSDEPGAECVDWPPMFDMFARRRTPAPHEARRVDFVTSSPGVSATMHWATVVQQQRALTPSTLALRADPLRRRFAGTTENVARLALDASWMPGDGGAPGSTGQPITVELDGQTLTGLAPDARGVVHLVRGAGEGDGGDSGGAWTAAAGPAGANQKRPERAGLFKDAFRERVVLVYASGGDEREDAWALGKARFDSEHFWVRGNATLRVVSDRAFVEDARRGADAEFAGRSVILYGNADTNLAWDLVLRDCPVVVRRGVVRAGNNEAQGRHLVALFTFPRAGSDSARVGVVGVSGPEGERAAERAPYFVSGVAYPDWVVYDATVLERGFAGVRGAGFFDNSWRMGTDWAWR
jgi:predicted esterase